MKKKKSSGTLFELLQTGDQGVSVSENGSKSASADEQHPDAGGTAPGNTGSRFIAVRVDTAAVVGVCVVVLLVAAFLIGRMSAPAAITAKTPESKAPAGRAQVVKPHALAVGETPAVKAEKKWTVRVASYSRNKKALADEVVRFLKTKFSDVFTRTTSRHIVVYVGRFSKRNDLEALKMRSRIKNLRYKRDATPFKDADFHSLDR